MEKEEVVKLLEKHGFTAVFESGVPMAVYEGGEKEMNDTYDGISKILKDSGYAGSFGVRGVAKNKPLSKPAYSQLRENNDGQLSFI